MGQYERLYFPYPIFLTANDAERLAAWVKAGGVLICEACPGYFGDQGRVGTRQPNNGLDTVFGVRENDVEFMPDIAGRYNLQFDGRRATCGGFLQTYTLASGTPMGYTGDGRLAVVEHSFGQGRTLLIGSHV